MVKDLSKGIDEDSIKEAYKKMKKKGVRVTMLKELKKQVK